MKRRTTSADFLRGRPLMGKRAEDSVRREQVDGMGESLELAQDCVQMLRQHTGACLNNMHPSPWVRHTLYGEARGAELSLGYLEGIIRNLKALLGRGGDGS